MNSISFDIGEQNSATIFSFSLINDLREKKQDFEDQLKFNEVNFATS